MRGNELEYEQVLNFVRYFLDYRIKIFNFYVLLNGALLTVTLTYINQLGGRIIISAFAAVISVIALFADKRCVSIADHYREAAMRLERQLGFADIQEVHKICMEPGIRFRFLFAWLYYLLMIIWILIILFSILSQVAHVKLL